MVLCLAPRKEPLAVVDEPTSSNGDQFVERVVFHPVRKQIDGRFEDVSH